MHGALYCGRRFRNLNPIDGTHGECLAIKVEASIPSVHLIRVWNRLDYYDASDAICLGNHPEMVVAVSTKWVPNKGIAIRYIQPRKSNQKALTSVSTVPTERKSSTPICLQASNKFGSENYSGPERFQGMPPT